MNVETQDEKAKTPFWPNKRQVLGGLGFVGGVNAGPFLIFLAVSFLEWLNPHSADRSLFLIIFAYLASVPIGAVAGITLGLAVADRMKY